MMAGWGSFALLALFEFTSPAQVEAPVDSNRTRSLAWNTQGSASLLLLQNWKNEQNTQYILQLGSTLTASQKLNRAEWNYRLEMQLGCTGYVDSLFKKDSDKFTWQGMLKGSNRKISHALNSGISSVLFDQYSMNLDPVTGKVVKSRIATFGNPSAIELGYGLGISLWKSSTVGISLATARLHVEPEFTTMQSTGRSRIGAVHHGGIFFDYGFSCQWALERNFKKQFAWNSSGKIFVTGFRNDAVRFDSSHSMRYKLKKHLQVKADLRWIYEPRESLSMQYRNEWLFGILYEKIKQ